MSAYSATAVRGGCVRRHSPADGRFIASGLTDAFGHAQLGGVAPVLANLVKSALGL